MQYNRPRSMYSATVTVHFSSSGLLVSGYTLQLQLLFLPYLPLALNRQVGNMT